jgi:hypothetical protein
MRERPDAASGKANSSRRGTGERRVATIDSRWRARQHRTEPSRHTGTPWGSVTAPTRRAPDLQQLARRYRVQRPVRTLRAQAKELVARSCA